MEVKESASGHTETWRGARIHPEESDFPDQTLTSYSVLPLSTKMPLDKLFPMIINHTSSHMHSRIYLWRMVSLMEHSVTKRISCNYSQGRAGNQQSGAVNRVTDWVPSTQQMRPHRPRASGSLLASIIPLANPPIMQKVHSARKPDTSAFYIGLSLPRSKPILLNLLRWLIENITWDCESYNHLRSESFTNHLKWTNL